MKGQYSCKQPSSLVLRLTRDDGNLGVAEDLIGVRKVKVEETVRTDRAGFNQSGPLGVVARDLGIACSSLQLDTVRIVTLVVGSIDLGLQKMALVSKLDKDMVAVAGSARSLGFPAITHVLSASRKKNVAAGSVVLVAGIDGTTAIACESQIDDFSIVLFPSVSQSE